MGLLDSDAEELKKNATDDTKSGRKVNQSGLGAFRGLSKYSNLTAKYRSTGKEPSPSPQVEGVEHSRGTISKSVQTGGEVGAESFQHKPSLGNGDASAQVGANQVQSPPAKSSDECVDSLPLANIELSSKSVHTQADVGAPGVSVRSAGEHVGEVILDNRQSVNGSSKSVHFNEKDVTNYNIRTGEASELRAKSVRDMKLTSSSDTYFGYKNIEQQTEYKVSAKESQIHSNLNNKTALNSRIRPGAKSVQTGADVGADTHLNSKIPTQNLLRAKSMQGQVKVGPKSVRDEVSSFEIESQMFHGNTDLITQLNSKVIPKHIEDQTPTESVMALSGAQRIIVEFFYQCCVWNNSLITPPITKSRLIQETGLSDQTAISAIKRLRNKFIVDRHAYKDGKAGWTQYKISEISYKELVHLSQMGGRSFSARVELPANKPSRVVVAPMMIQEPTWFKELDFSSVKPIGPMVVNSSIRAMVQEKLKPELVQEFLNRFTSWLATQGKISSPTGIFCDKLKELAREGDSPVLACMTAAEREVEAVYAQNLDKARAEMEFITKSKEHQEAQDLSNRFESEFQRWFADIGQDELRILVPGNTIAPFGSDMHKALVRGHFEEHVWSSL